MFESDPDIVGVDFSGAAKAGRHIWIAECSASDETLTVDECYAAESKVGTDERDRVLEELCDAIASASACVVGLDFPFGVPNAVTESDEWGEFVRGFGDEYDSPDEFREGCRRSVRATSERSNPDLQRETEQGEIRGLCSYNLRIRHQTFYGIRDVLGELLDEDVAIRPMRDETDADVNVVEVYPAATLADIDADRTGYKRQRQESHDTRRRILRKLQDSEIRSRTVEFSDEMFRNYALCDDNALDAVVCAVAADRAESDDFDTDDERYDPVEGYIYV